MREQERVAGERPDKVLKQESLDTRENPLEPPSSTKAQL